MGESRWQVEGLFNALFAQTKDDKKLKALLEYVKADGRICPCQIIGINFGKFCQKKARWHGMGTCLAIDFSGLVGYTFIVKDIAP